MSNKISLIIKREYISRVRKKSFLVMTILGPILFAALMVLPSYLANKSDKTKRVNVVDETGIYAHRMKNSSSVKFRYLSESLGQAQAGFNKDSADALLYIPATESSRNAKAVI